MEKIREKILDAFFSICDLFMVCNDSSCGLFVFFLVIVLFYSPVCWYMTPFFRTPGVLDVGKNTLYVQVQEEERTLEEIISELREKLDEIERW